MLASDIESTDKVEVSADGSSTDFRPGDLGEPSIEEDSSICIGVEWSESVLIKSDGLLFWVSSRIMAEIAESARDLTRVRERGNEDPDGGRV